ncbi:MAG: PilT/PilU family type 4a pilus ATPase [Desulfobacterales bacterium]|nr:PilT/PilU family type 4a pilus ATPase [Desulfobacterales bacterium]
MERKEILDDILTTMLESYDNVSDLNITADKPFQIESVGELMPVSMTPPVDKLTPFQTEAFALNLINGDRRLIKELLTEGSCDFSYELTGKARFRVNIFSQRRCFSIVMRRLATRVPTMRELDLPPAFYKMPEELNGIILVTGATGTGKTTSLAAMLNEISESRSIHIVTLEDPVEYAHSQKKATFNQRELGSDFSSFASGLRAALRQAPKVILVGEMRDRETVEIGLAAAETGHLVLSTLHTVDAGHTIDRIAGMFEQDEERLIRTRLAGTLRWIVCQRLMPKITGGRIAAFEIMGSNMRIRDTILHGETEGKTFYEIIEESNAFGMITFDQFISNLFKKGLITEQTAMSYSSRKDLVGRAIDAIKAARGEKTTHIEDLDMDTDYGKSPEEREFT